MPTSFNKRYQLLALILLCIFNLPLIIAPVTAQEAARQIPPHEETDTILNTGILEAMTVWSAARYCLFPDICGDSISPRDRLAYDYEENHVKHLGYVGITVNGTVLIPLEGGVRLYYDLDDYNSITPEGQEGWVTIWVNTSGAIGPRAEFPLSGGVGIMRVERGDELPDGRRFGDDSLNSFTIKPESLSAAGGLISCDYLPIAADGDVEAIECSSFTDLTPSLVSWNLATIESNVLRLEVRKSELLDIVKDAADFAHINAEEFTVVAYAKAFLANFLLLDPTGIALGTPVGVRGFTAHDNGNAETQSGAFTATWGGVDVDGDRLPDSIYPRISGNGTNGNLQIAFEGLSYDPENLSWEPNYHVEAVPLTSGWEIWASEDGIPTDTQRYDVDQIGYGEQGYTYWTILSSNTAPDEASFEFQLYLETWFGLSRVLVNTHVVNVRATDLVNDNVPSIQHTPIASAYVGDQIEIFADITTASSSPLDVRLAYRATDSGVYVVTPMTQNGDRYSKTLNAINASHIDYYIFATDGALSAYNPPSRYTDDYHRITLQTRPIISTVALTPDAGSYEAGSTATVDVYVEDNDGIAVATADMSYEFDGQDLICGQGGVTCSNLGSGNYRVSFTVPTNNGTYQLAATAHKDPYADGYGTTPITVYSAGDYGHNVEITTLFYPSGEKQNNHSYTVTADVHNIGNYSESVRVDFTLYDPNGNTVDTAYTTATIPMGSTIPMSVSLTTGSADGEYLIIATATLNSYNDFDPSDNTDRTWMWVGESPVYYEYGLNQYEDYDDSTATALGSTGYSVYVEFVNGNEVIVDIYKGGTRIANDHTLDMDEINTYDGNNLVIIYWIDIHSVPDGAVFLAGTAGNTGVSFEPDVASAPAGTSAVFRVDAPSNWVLRYFEVDVRESGDDYNTVSNWNIDDDQLGSPDLVDLYFDIPAGTSPQLYEFWMSFDDRNNNAGFDEMIRHLFIDVQPPHDIQTIVSAPSSAGVGQTVDISFTTTNASSYTERNLETFVTITNTSGYSTTMSYGPYTLNSGQNTTQILQWNTGGLAQGTYTITARTDLGGDAYPNNNQQSTTLNLTAPPTLAVVATPSTINTEQGTPETIGATVTYNSAPVTGASVQYRVRNASNQVVAAGQLIEDGGGDYSLTIVAPITIGNYTVELTATNAGYTDGTAQASMTVAQALPNTIITSPPYDDFFNHNNITFRWRGTSTLYSEDQLVFRTRIDGGAWSAYSATLSLTQSFSDGAHTFEVQAKDPAGGEDPTPALYAFTIDTVVPTFDANPTISPTSGQRGTALAITVDVSEESYATADFSALDSDYDPANVQTTVLDAINFIYQVSYTISPTNLRATGTYTIPVPVIDAASNITTYNSLTFDYTASNCFRLTGERYGEGATIAFSPTKSASCTLDSEYIAGETITLTAAPAQGWHLSAWSGTDDDASTALTNTLTMPAQHHVVSVLYEVPCYQLTLSHTGNGDPLIADPTRSTGCSSSHYTEGATINLTANSATGYIILGWSGTNNNTSTATTNTVTMPAAAHASSVAYGLDGINVNSTLDAVDANPGDNICAASGGECTLRAAIMEANALAGADSIYLPSGTYTLTLNGSSEDGSATGDLDINGDLLIVGEDRTTSIIDGNQLDRVLHITGSYNVTLQTLTIRNGNTSDIGGGILNRGTLTLNSVTVRDNTAVSAGGIFHGATVNNYLLTLNDSAIIYNTGTDTAGGMRSDASSVTLNNSQINNNTAQRSGGFENYHSRSLITIVGSEINNNTATGTVGGGMYLYSGSVVNIRDSVIAGNQALSYGGGIYANAATLTFEGGVEIGQSGNGNIADSDTNNVGSGGGIYIRESDFTIYGYGNAFVGNSAADGGGINTYLGTTNIYNTLFTENVSYSSGGGGAVRNTGDVTIVNSTLSGNDALWGGAIITVDTATLDLINVTMTDNSASGGGGIYVLAPTSFGNTIVSGNTGGNCAISGATVTTYGNNIESTNSCQFTDASDMPDTDPMLGVLADNGGTSPTHALLEDSPAIDGGNTALLPADTYDEDTDSNTAESIPFDARGTGFPRVRDAAVDVGSHEQEAVLPCYALTLSHLGSGTNPAANPAQSANCNAGEYHEGASISLTAQPDAGWQVANWTGTDNDASTVASNTLTMPTNAHSASVTYEQTCYLLTLSYTGSGADPVANPTNSTNCNAGEYVSGEAISLTAQPDSGYRVASWSGTDNDASTATNNTLTMLTNAHSAGVTYELDASFTTTSIDDIGLADADGSAMVMRDGNPIIVYPYSVTGGHNSMDATVRLALCDNPTCTSATIRDIDTGFRKYIAPSIALHNGIPYITYYVADVAQGDLRLAICNDVDCSSPTIKTLDSAGDTGAGSNIRITSSGNPVIAYYDATPDTLELLSCNDATCNSFNLQSLETLGGGAGQISMELLNDRPVIVYPNTNSGTLRLAVCDSAACGSATFRTIFTGQTGHTFPNDVALNGSNPVISFYNNGDASLRLIVCDDTTCSSRTTQTLAANSGTGSALTLDNHNPVLSYQRTTDNTLMVMQCADSTCTSRNTVEISALSWASDIALDSGAIFISYLDTVNDTLDLTVMATSGTLDYDVNNDGIVSPTDAMYVINRLGSGDTTADVNGDGNITDADANLILAHLGE